MHAVCSGAQHADKVLQLCMQGNLTLDQGGYYEVTAVGTAAEVQAIMRDEAADCAASNADDFWVLAAALKRFVENEGCGSLPLEVTQHLACTAAACLSYALHAIDSCLWHPFQAASRVSSV